MSAKRAVAVLLSGRGSNMVALAEAAARPDYPARIVTVLSDKADAPGLSRARALGLPAGVVARAQHPSKPAFEAALDAELRAAGAEFICLAGFMRLLSAAFLAGWHDRVLNIHPSLLPAFKGLSAQAQALAAGVRIAGCTVHIVRPEMDAGPIIAQAAVPVLADDSLDRLEARILAAEHRLYPRALALFCQGRVRLTDGRARVDAPTPAPTALYNPPAD